MSQMMYVTAASFDDVEDALEAFKGIDGAYRHVGASYDFDAAVVAKDHEGKVDIVKRHDEPSRHGAAVGLNLGLAVGLIAAVLPPVGIIGGLVVGGAGGAAIGAVRGRAQHGADKGDLKAIAEMLNSGDAGLIVFYAPEMAGHIESYLTRATGTVHETTGITAEELAAEIRAIETGRATG